MTQERCPVWLCLGSCPHTSSGQPVLSQLFSHPEHTRTHTNIFHSAERLAHLLLILCISYLSERQLHVGVSIEVIASDGLSDLSDLCWRRRTDWLLLLCGWHLLVVCEEHVRRLPSVEVEK